MINNLNTPRCLTCNREMVHYNAFQSSGNKQDGFTFELLAHDNNFCRVCDVLDERAELED